MRIKRISKNLIEERNQIIWETWERKKSYLTMIDIAKVFKIDVSLIHKIIKEVREKKIVTDF